MKQKLLSKSIWNRCYYLTGNQQNNRIITAYITQLSKNREEQINNVGITKIFLWNKHFLAQNNQFIHFTPQLHRSINKTTKIMQKYHVKFLLLFPWEFFINIIQFSMCFLSIQIHKQCYVIVEIKRTFISPCVFYVFVIQSWRKFATKHSLKNKPQNETNNDGKDSCTKA